MASNNGTTDTERVLNFLAYTPGASCPASYLTGVIQVHQVEELLSAMHTTGLIRLNHATQLVELTQFGSALQETF